MRRRAWTLAVCVLALVLAADAFDDAWLDETEDDVDEPRALDEQFEFERDARVDADERDVVHGWGRDDDAFDAFDADEDALETSAETTEEGMMISTTETEEAETEDADEDANDARVDAMEVVEERETDVEMPVDVERSLLDETTAEVSEGEAREDAALDVVPEADAEDVDGWTAPSPAPTSIVPDPVEVDASAAETPVDEDDAAVDAGAAEEETAAAVEVVEDVVEDVYEDDAAVDAGAAEQETAVAIEVVEDVSEDEDEAAASSAFKLGGFFSRFGAKKVSSSAEDMVEEEAPEDEIEVVQIAASVPEPVAEPVPEPMPEPEAEPKPAVVIDPDSVAEPKPVVIIDPDPVPDPLAGPKPVAVEVTNDPEPVPATVEESDEDENNDRRRLLSQQPAPQQQYVEPPPPKPEIVYVGGYYRRSNPWAKGPRVKSVD